MFFITPQKEHLVPFAESETRPGSSKKRKQGQQPEPQPNDEYVSGYYPRRIPKACDRCRVKKVKCSGGQLCRRCESDGVVCITTSNMAKEEAPVDPRQYHLVESQRDRLLQILSEILQGKNENEVAKLRGLLSNMGLSIKGLPIIPPTNKDTSASVMVNSDAFEQVPGPVWLELYNGLKDKGTDSLRFNSDEFHSTTLAGESREADIPLESGASHANTFELDDLVDWNSFLAPMQPEQHSFFDPLPTVTTVTNAEYPNHTLHPPA